MSKKPRGIFDYAPKAAARNRSLLSAEDAGPGFFSASLEDVWKKKYGGRYPGLAENVASGAATGLKAIGVPKHVAETTGRNITDLAEWTPFGMLTAAEHMPEAIRSGNVKDIGLTALGVIPIVGGKVKKAAKVVEALVPNKPKIRAYHGSPHSFEPEPDAPLGRFRDTEIGSGEGAQAYGRGHYLAENEGVAKSYKGTVPANLHPLNPKNFWTPAETPSGGGHMYEVDINADPEHFLDWDKPIAEQPRIAAAIDERVGDPDIVFERLGIDPKTAGGGELVRGLGGAGGGKDLAVSAKLQEWGFPGIKYLDQGSRGKGSGSRNYVVFDPKIIEIVRKYGIVGALGAGLISQSDADALAAGAGGAAGPDAGGGAPAGPASPAPRSPIAALDERVMDEAYATRSSPRDVLKRMLGLP